MTKFYTVYCTTNRINGKYYIGVHQTTDLQDGYLGSGKILKRSIAKYGVAAFEKDICQIYGSAKEAFAKEELLVRVHRRNKLCMNLREGGAGGYDYINATGIRSTSVDELNLARVRKLKSDPLFRARFSAATSAGRAKAVLTPLQIQQRAARSRRQQALIALAWKGKHHTLESRQLMSAKKIGHLNNQFGTCWITDGQLNRKMRRNDPLPTGWKLGRVIKKFGV